MKRGFTARSAMISTLILVFVFLQHSVCGDMCWDGWDLLLTGPQALSCVVVIDPKVHILGGLLYNTSNDTSHEISISIQNPKQFEYTYPFLPVEMHGPFCAQLGTTVFVTRMASSMLAGEFVFPTFDDKVYVSDLLKPQDHWMPLTPRINRRRCGIVATKRALFLFGGMGSDEKYVSKIEAYEFSSNSWSVVADKPKTSTWPSSCDCYIADSESFIVTVCSTCEAETVNSQLHLLKFSKALNAFVGEPVFLDIGANRLSCDITMMEHYLLLLVISREADNTLSSVVYYYDLQLKQMNAIMCSPPAEPRYSGSIFKVNANIYLVGGINAEGNLSSNIDTLAAYPLPEEVDKREDNLYYAGENVTVKLRIGCVPGLTMRISPTSSCIGKLSGSEPSNCTPALNDRGAIVFNMPVTEPHDVGFLCLSYGVCPSSTQSRKSCPNGDENIDFQTCIFNRCCWDDTVKGASRCFAFEDASNTSDLFYYQINEFPITVLPRTIDGSSPDTDGAFVKFVKTPTGIALTAMVSLICVLALYGIVRRVMASSRSKNSQTEEGSQHPLDQHGRYKVLCKLGQGGFGTVFLVSRKSDNAKLAMKYIVCKDNAERAYALKEFELLQGAQGHENMIVLIEMFMNWSDDPSILESVKTLNDDSSLGSGKSGKVKSETQPLLQVAPKYVCIVMEYCPEGDFGHYILRQRAEVGKIPEKMLVQVVAKQVCSLLQHLHALTPPIVHRDMKPENLLLANNGQKIIVTDFGLAQQVEKSYMTTRAGSLHYVAPECWKRHYTSAVDMWALGCILYAACTGRVTQHTARVMFSDAREKWFKREITNDLKDYSETMRKIILGLLETNPHKRLSGKGVLDIIEEAYPTDQIN